jgi:hypothetical protein
VQNKLCLAEVHPVLVFSINKTASSGKETSLVAPFFLGWQNQSIDILHETVYDIAKGVLNAD